MGDLPAHEFAGAVAALPLVAIDWVLTDPDGRLLLARQPGLPAAASPARQLAEPQ